MKVYVLMESIWTANEILGIFARLEDAEHMKKDFHGADQDYYKIEEIEVIE